MDQGIAAVLGAGVGITGTLGAALLGYMGARRQSRDQGRVNHALRLRDDRKEVYLAFLEEEERLRDIFEGARSSLLPDEHSETPWLRIETKEQSLRDGLGELQQRRTRIALAGPQEVEMGADRMCAAVSDAACHMRECLREAGRPTPAREQRLHSISLEFDAARQQYIDAVRRALTEPTF